MRSLSSLVSKQTIHSWVADMMLDMVSQTTNSVRLDVVAKA